MASVFSKEPEQELSVLDIVRDTLDVDGEGNVTFRTRRGKGSGASTVIPGTQFDEFVNLLTATRESRVALAQRQRESDSATTEATDSSDSE